MNKTAAMTAGILMLAGSEVAQASGEASLLIGRSYVDQFLLNNHTGFGGTLGAYSKILGIELGIDYMPVTDFQISGADLGASFLNVMGNVVVQIPLGDFLPYGTVGYGALFADSDPELESVEFLGTFGALNYGFGAKLFFSEAVGVRVDYRRFSVQAGDDEESLEIPLVGTRIESSPDFDRLMFGLAFRW